MVIYTYYTDGAATMVNRNGKYLRQAGGWAFICLKDGEETSSQSGGCPLTTNNEMELYAIYASILDYLEIANDDDSLVICSDSAYCINIFKSWAHGWQKRGWRKSDGTYVYPDEFIPAFESNGCIRKTDYFVYDYVFKYLRERLDKGLPCIPISMNVSRIHLFNNQFVEYIQSLLEKYKVPVELLEFELTESICLEGLPSVVNTLQWLKQQNIKISIDDFGSGYSSLEVLTRLPISVLKLDKVFMKKDLSNNDKIIIASIVEMARLLGLDVICEGVEEDAQRIFLIEACCEKLQGFLFSKPVPAAEFSKMLEREFAIG